MMIRSLPRKARRTFQAVAGLSLLSLASVLPAQDEPTPAEAESRAETRAETRAEEVTLEPIPAADLEPLETSVREVIEDRQKALVELLRAGESDRRTMATTFGELGFLYHAHELWPQALASYRNALTLDPADPRWPYAAALAEEARGELDIAAVWLDHVLDMLPENATALVRLAEIRLRQNQLGEAKALLRHALSASPESPAALAALGQLSLQAERPRDAVGYFERALDQVPEANRLHYPLGLAYRALGDLDQAKEHLAKRGEVGVRPYDPVREAIEERKAGARVYILEGRKAFSAGRFADAAALFEKARDAEPENLAARVNLATARAMMGDETAAMAEFDSILEADPENAAAHYNLGVIRARAGDLEAARGHLERSVARDPEDAEAHAWLGRVLVASGEREAALEPIEKAVELRPNDEDSWVRLAQVLADLGRHAEARARLEEAHRLMPDQGVPAHALARLLATSPDLDERNGELAVNLAMRVAQAAPSIEHLLTLAASLAEAGRCDEAEQVQAQVVEAAAEAPEADRARFESLRAAYAAGPPCRP